MRLIPDSPPPTKEKGLINEKSTLNSPGMRLTPDSPPHSGSEKTLLLLINTLKTPGMRLTPDSLDFNGHNSFSLNELGSCWIGKQSLDPSLPDQQTKKKEDSLRSGWIGARMSPSSLSPLTRENGVWSWEESLGTSFLGQLQDKRRNISESVGWAPNERGSLHFSEYSSFDYNYELDYENEKDLNDYVLDGGSLLLQWSVFV